MMKKKINKLSQKAVVLVVMVASFLIGYGISFLPQTSAIPSANAQGTIQSQRCYALRTPSVGYDEFIEGTPDKEESIVLPPGWTVAGFTVSKPNSSGRALTMVCGPDTPGE